MLHDILLILLGLVIGFIIGFVVARKLIQKEMKNYKWNSLPRFAKLKKEKVM